MGPANLMKNNIYNSRKEDVITLLKKIFK